MTLLNTITLNRVEYKRYFYSKAFKKQKATILKVSQYYLFYCLHQTNTKKKNQSNKPLYMPFLHCLSLSNYAIFYTYKTLLHTFFFFQYLIILLLTLNQPIIWIKFIQYLYFFSAVCNKHFLLAFLFFPHSICKNFSDTFKTFQNT